MYGKDAAFLVVYIREAHPTDGERPLRRGVRIADPQSLLERERVAGTCAEALRFTMPMVIDDLDDRAARAYGAYPDRLWIVGKDGRIAYRGGPGPRGFQPDAMEAALEKILAETPKPKRARL